MTSKEKTYLGVGLAGAAALATLVAISKAKAPPPTSNLQPNLQHLARMIIIAQLRAGQFYFSPVGAIARFFPGLARYYPGTDDALALAAAIAAQAVAMGGNAVVDTAGNVMIEFGKGVLKNPLSSLVGWTMVLGALGAAALFFAPAVREKASTYRRLGAPQPAGWPR